MIFVSSFHQKAGIIKPGCPTFCARQTEGAEERIRSIATQRDAPIYFVDESWISHRLPTPPPSFWSHAAYQRENATLAVALAESFLRSTSGYETKENKMLPQFVIDALQNTEWPGRAQRLRVEFPEVCGSNRSATFYIDGAHTAQSMLACEAWYNNFASERSHSPKRVLFFNCSHEKNAIDLLLPLLRCNFDEVHIVPFDSFKPTSMDYRTLEELIQHHPLFEPVKDYSELQQMIKRHEVRVDDQKPHLTWQYTLASICRVLPRLLEYYGESLKNEGYSTSIREPNYVKVHSSVKDGLQEILSETFETQITDTHKLRRIPLHHDISQTRDTSIEVLATGSLYLVGNTLQHLGWRAS